MDKNKINDNLFNEYASVPFSVIITLPDTKILYKNELAKLQFSTLRKGSSLSKYSDIKEIGDFIIQKNLFGKDYFVSSSKLIKNGEEFKIFYLIETFFAAEEYFTDLILTNSASILANIDAFLKPLSEEFVKENKPYKTILKNSETVRKMQNTLLRFLHLSEYKSGQNFHCGLYGLFSLMQKKLSVCGIKIDFDISKLSNVVFSYKALAFVMLNIIEFCKVYASQNEFVIETKENGSETEISISVDDKNGIVTAYNDVFGFNDAEKACAFLPLFSAMTVLKQNKRKIKFISKNGETHIMFSLKQSFAIPEDNLHNVPFESLDFVSNLIKDIFY